MSGDKNEGGMHGVCVTEIELELFSPIFQRNTIKPVKIPGIICNQNKAAGNCSSSNQRVKIINQIALFSETSLFFGVYIQGADSSYKCDTV